MGLNAVLLNATHRPHSSSFLVFRCRILKGSPKKELLWGLWVDTVGFGFRVVFAASR